MVCFKFVTSRCLSFSRLLSSASTTIFRSSLFDASIFLDAALLSLSSLCVFLASSSFSFNSSLSLVTFSIAAFASCFAARTLCMASVCFVATRSASNRDLAPANVCVSAYFSISSFLPSLIPSSVAFCSVVGGVGVVVVALLFFFLFPFSSSFSSSSSEISSSRFSSPRRFFIRQFLNSDVVIGFPGNAKVLRICSRGSPK
mmetsp:Transcript_9379/g.27086  ORF Transcript_9379/g.27086 Transcript_9379/m.27086 type:complete len:201 (-) Transcript_9379:388-990(-)